MEQRWVMRDHPRELIQKLKAELNVPTIIAKVLLNRGVEDFDAARRFLRPSLEDLHDPFLMADMDRATGRICRAIRDGEGIMIHGDYDVDGVTGTSLLTRVLGSLGAKTSFYIPDRFREGYGISRAGIKEGVRRNASLIISVDCGITALDEVDFANSLGIDVIITDHHEPRERLPDALAVIDPKRDECGYPFKELAGVALAFKLLQALFRRQGLDSELLYDNIDLAALGCAADIVPLVDENRVLVKYGLEKMAKTENLGLRALIDSAGISGKPLGTGHLVFIMAPRINAAGRMGDARKVVSMLTTDSEGQARNIAQILESENRKRKEIDGRIFSEAMAMVERSADLDQDFALVLASEGWHQGVIGIVASRIVEKFHLPTVLISLTGDVGKGSARSIPGFDLYSALSECSQALVAFGGHRYAAGLTIERDRIDEFREALQNFAKFRLSPEDRVRELKIDGEISFREIDHRLVRLLSYFAPFGPSNMRPVMVSRGVEVVGSPAIVGDNHIKFKARQDKEVLDCIGFDMGHLFYRLAPGEPNLDMAYVIEENEWRGRRSIQLRVKDLR